jgi:hypothetical protein
MKHECAVCGAVMPYLIMQRKGDGTYVLNCEFHTNRAWPAVAGIHRELDDQMVLKQQPKGGKRT